MSNKPEESDPFSTAEQVFIKLAGIFEKSLRALPMENKDRSAHLDRLLEIHGERFSNPKALDSVRRMRNDISHGNAVSHDDAVWAANVLEQALKHDIFKDPQFPDDLKLKAQRYFGRLSSIADQSSAGTSPSTEPLPLTAAAGWRISIGKHWRAIIVGICAVAGGLSLGTILMNLPHSTGAGTLRPNLKPTVPQQGPAPLPSTRGPSVTGQPPESRGKPPNEPGGTGNGRKGNPAGTELVKTQDKAKPPVTDAVIGTTADDKLRSAAVPAAPPAAVLRTVLTQEAHQFSMTVRSCTLRANSIVCALQVTNHAEPRRMGLVAGPLTRMIDDSGREYASETVRIGQKSESIAMGIASTELVSGSPVAAELSFPKVSPGIIEISLLEVACWREAGGTDIKFRFTSIPVLR